MLHLGRLHFTGTAGEISANYIQSRDYFHDAAQLGNTVALYNLGIMTLNG